MRPWRSCCWLSIETGTNNNDNSNNNDNGKKTCQLYIYIYIYMHLRMREHQKYIADSSFTQNWMKYTVLCVAGSRLAMPSDAR